MVLCVENQVDFYCIIHSMKMLLGYGIRPISLNAIQGLIERVVEDDKASTRLDSGTSKIVDAV